MSRKLVDRPERVFQLWAFTVGMNRLLLRSVKSESHPTRIDVLFQNVKAMSLPTQLDGLVITEPVPARERDLIEETGLMPDEGTVFFEIETSGRTGFVVAGVVVVDEDQGEFFEPSKYWPGPGGFTR